MKFKKTLRWCCKECGFPIAIQREPVFLKSNILSYLEYEENKCETCGCQKDGTTIPVTNEAIQKIANNLIRERDNILKFFQHYHNLTSEERKEICVKLPRFMNPNFDSEKEQDGDWLEPYSWNVVKIELLENTKLGKALINNIDWSDKNV